MVENATIENPDLSWKAKGIHSYLLGRPPGWQMNRKDLINRATDGDAALRSGLQELQDAGLLVIRERPRDGEGQYRGTVWEVYRTPRGGQVEMPMDGPHVENPHAGNPHVGNPHVGNPHDYKYGGNKNRPLRGRRDGDEQEVLDMGMEPTIGDVHTALMQHWLAQFKRPPDRATRSKQAAKAKALAERHDADHLGRAVRGITKVAPHCPPMNEPWDLYDLERKMAKAVAAAEQDDGGSVLGEAARLAGL